MSFDDIFDESFDRVLSASVNGTDFFEAFYQRFLRASPEIQMLFRDTDMARQRSMLKKSFYSLVAFYASGTVDDVLRRVAHCHSAEALNIKPHLYDLWMECLIDTVRVFDPEYTDNVELAWRLILSPGITYMKFGYDHF
ncbi:globin [Marinobacter halotolerans]|uniref:globin n=1 Tax=Marinobacter halotolerans TaxID=1569211 RepID=UPI001246F72C|nr:globin [Marinobacter halotolerans]